MRPDGMRSHHLERPESLLPLAQQAPGTLVSTVGDYRVKHCQPQARCFSFNSVALVSQ